LLQFLYSPKVYGGTVISIQSFNHSIFWLLKPTLIYGLKTIVCPFTVCVSTIQEAIGFFPPKEDTAPLIVQGKIIFNTAPNSPLIVHKKLAKKLTAIFTRPGKCLTGLFFILQKNP
jgi:hypothetical protein